MILADTHWGLQAKDEAAKVAIVREYQETQQALAKKQAADRKAKREALNGKSGGTRIESTHARPFARTPAWAMQLRSRRMPICACGVCSSTGEEEEGDEE
jgi:hypothetical protein|eukprot:COSAG01_NODE_8075_length_2930_cov_47.724832_3_plen_100_part_00